MASAAVLNGVRALDALSEEHGPIGSVSDPRSVESPPAGCVMGGADWPMDDATGGEFGGEGEGGSSSARSPVARHVPVGPVLFTPAMLGAVGGGGWGDGPSTVAPTPQHPAGTPISAERGLYEGQSAADEEEKDWGERACGAGSRSGLHNMVSRSIFAGPTVEVKRGVWSGLCFVCESCLFRVVLVSHRLRCTKYFVTKFQAVRSISSPLYWSLLVVRY